MGVEEHESRGDPGAERAGLVGEYASKEGKTLSGGERGSPPRLCSWKIERPGELVAGGPVQEGAEPVAFVDRVLDDPGVEVDLAAAVEGEAPFSEPGEEAGGVDDPHAISNRSGQGREALLGAVRCPGRGGHHGERGRKRSSASAWPIILLLALSRVSA